MPKCKYCKAPIVVPRKPRKKSKFCEDCWQYHLMITSGCLYRIDGNTCYSMDLSYWDIVEPSPEGSLPW